MNSVPSPSSDAPHVVGDYYLNQQISDIKSSIGTIKTDMTNEFREMRNGLRDMVSQKEFEATIARIDQKHESQDTIIARNKEHADKNHESVLKGLGEIKSSARWWVGIGVSLLAILIPVITNLISGYFNTLFG